MTPARRVAAEMLALCFRAGVGPDDGSEAAGRAVNAVVARELEPSPADVLLCPLSEWLTRRLGVRAYAAHDAVIVPLPCAAATVRCRHGEERIVGAVSAVRVPLPLAVRVAVWLVDRRKDAGNRKRGDAA